MKYLSLILILFSVTASAAKPQCETPSYGCTDDVLRCSMKFYSYDDSGDLSAGDRGTLLNEKSVFVLVPLVDEYEIPAVFQESDFEFWSWINVRLDRSVQTGAPENPMIWSLKAMTTNSKSEVLSSAFSNPNSKSGNVLLFDAERSRVLEILCELSKN